MYQKVTHFDNLIYGSSSFFCFFFSRRLLVDKSRARPKGYYPLRSLDVYVGLVIHIHRWPTKKNNSYRPVIWRHSFISPSLTGCKMDGLTVWMVLNLLWGPRFHKSSRQPPHQSLAWEDKPSTQVMGILVGSDKNSSSSYIHNNIIG